MYTKEEQGSNFFMVKAFYKGSITEVLVNANRIDFVTRIAGKLNICMGGENIPLWSSDDERKVLEITGIRL